MELNEMEKIDIVCALTRTYKENLKFQDRNFKQENKTILKVIKEYLPSGMFMCEICGDILEKEKEGTEPNTCCACMPKEK